jgi:hypothetical protein
MRKYLGVLILLTFTLASCTTGTSDSNFTPLSDSGSAAGSASSTASPGFAWGRVLTDRALAGSSISMRTLDGDALLATTTVDANGNFYLFGAKLPSDADFIVLVTPPQGSSWVPLKLFVRGYRPGQLLHVNLLTTIEADILSRRPDLDVAKVRAAIAAWFALPPGTDIGAGVEESPRSPFSHLKYLELAAQAGGLEARIAADEANIEAGETGSAIVTGRPKRLAKTAGASSTSIDATAFGDTESLIEDLGENFLDLSPQAALTPVGWVVSSMLNNKNSLLSEQAAELATISAEVKVLEEEVSALSTDIATLEANLEYSAAANDLANNVITPINNLISDSATSIETLGSSFTVTDTPIALTSGLDTLSTGLTAYYASNEIDKLQNYMLGLNNATNLPQELQISLTGALNQATISNVVYGDFPLRSNVTGASSNSTSTGISAIQSTLDYYIGEQVQALNLLVESVHALSQPATSITYLLGPATEQNTANNLTYNMVLQEINSIPYFDSDYYFCDMTNFKTAFTHAPTKSAYQAVIYYTQFQGATYAYEQSNGQAVTSASQVEPTPTVTWGTTYGNSSDDKAAAFLSATSSFSAPDYTIGGWRLITRDEAAALRTLALQADSSSVSGGLTLLGFSGLTTDWIWVQDTDNEKIVTDGDVTGPTGVSSRVETTYTHPVHAYNIITGELKDSNSSKSASSTITSDFTEYQYLLTRDALPSVSYATSGTASCFEQMLSATGLRPVSMSLEIKQTTGSSKKTVYATGSVLYADGTYLDTNLNGVGVVFYSSDPTLVSISNSSGSYGQLTFHKHVGSFPSSVTITAVAPGMVSGTYASTTLTSTITVPSSDYTSLNTASISSIMVTPRNRILSTSSTNKFYATIFYNNKTVAEATSLATWTVKYTDGTTPLTTDVNFDSLVPGQLNVGSNPAQTSLVITATYDGTTSSTIYVDVDVTGTI